MPTFISNSEAETRQIAADFARSANSKIPVFVCLYGNLGSGKTVFTKGIAEGLGIPAAQIKSPTYTFVRQYRHGKIHFYHFDFYRIEDTDDLMAQDLLEIFSQKNAFIVIEWPEKVAGLIPSNHRAVRFSYKSDNQRTIIFDS